MILFPATTTALRQFPDYMWETLVKRLQENGKKVFCNMKGGVFRPQQMPIEGSTEIEVPVHLGMSLIRIAGRIISSPNGFQFLQMIGGQFDRMTVMLPMGDGMNDFVINQRTYAATMMLADYSYPEMCLDIPYNEFLLPFDPKDETKIKEIAIAAADLDTSHPACFRRKEGNEGLFVDANRDWLEPLIDPIRRPNLQ